MSQAPRPDPQPAALLHLHPGQIYFGCGELLVSTILGSCVAVALHHPASRHGSLTHALLPAPPDCGGRETDPRYVEASILRSLEFFAQLGVVAKELQAKVFGGAETLAGCSRSVGRQNVLAALEALADQGLTPMCRHVGGPCGRRLLFDPRSGAVYLKCLGAQAAGAS